MDSINERVKYLRKEVLKLTQTEFGEKIGISKPSISLIESGKNNLTERNIKGIVREFNVSPAWLTEGTGDIFMDNNAYILDQLAKEFGLNENEKELIKMFLELDEEERTAFLETLYKLFRK